MKNAQKPPTKLNTPVPSGNRSKRLTESRDKLRNCSFDGCNALTFRSTDHCWRHQDEPPSDPDLDQVADELVPEPEPEAEANWWEEKTE